jgi:hypothetical protein
LPLGLCFTSFRRFFTIVLLHSFNIQSHLPIVLLLLEEHGPGLSQPDLKLGLAASGPTVLHHQGDAKGSDHDQEHERAQPQSFHAIAPSLTSASAFPHSI